MTSASASFSFCAAPIPPKPPPTMRTRVRSPFSLDLFGISFRSKTDPAERSPTEASSGHPKWVISANSLCVHPDRTMLRVSPHAMLASVPNAASRHEGGGRMSKPFKGKIAIDVRDSVPDWDPYTQPKAPEGAASVLYIVLDDVGFSAMEPWGGLIETPNINRLAQNGLTHTNWHTTALCSPTRSSLLTGRNHTTNGMACIAEATTGFPNSNGHIPFECATIAEVLGERGWNTYMLGKWHLVAADEMNLAATKRNWPIGRGFERYYGFLGGETNQWYPDLIYDNHPVEQPSTPAEG